MDIAIIGAGISGLGAAFLLSSKHDITLYEKNDYIGGHSRTIDVQVGTVKTPVDTGFIVFNDWNYPHLIGLFDLLYVPYEKSDMSFGVSINDGWLEYSSSAMFAQKSNIMRPAYWGMLRDILRFNKQARAYIEKDADITLGACLDALNMGAWFRQYYLLAMGAAIWSCPVQTIMAYPARTFLQFFKNHGLLSVNDRPQWYTVKGGSRSYVEKLTHAMKDKVAYEGGVQSVARSDGRVVVTDVNGVAKTYDDVVFASHADEALRMIENPNAQQKDVLGAFGYQDNNIIVHTDRSFMPQNEKAWASWVYLSEDKYDEKPVLSLSYWMNNLQNFETPDPVIVTLNPGRRPKEDTIMDEHVFAHPIFDVPAIKAQGKIDDIQGKGNMWFCGAYQRYGFHEDGLWSAVNVAKAIGVDIPWE